MLIFIIVDNTNSLDLLSNGANFAPYSLSNQPYRLLSSLFIHSGFIHLAFNLYNLYLVGRLVEEQLGPIQFLIVYLFLGVMASLSSVYFNLFSISVGASGAIFGLYAFHFLMESQNRKVARTSLIISFILLFIINLVFANWFRIDNAAHVGGFVTGVLIFFLFSLRNKIAINFLLWLVPLVCFLLAPTFQKQYYDAYQYMLQKDDHIRSALNSFYLDQDEQAEKIKVIRTLPDSIKLKFSQIQNIHHSLMSDTSIINHFFTLRTSQINYFLQLLENDSYLYEDSILYVRDLLANAPRPFFQLNFENQSADNTAPSIGRSGLRQEREYYDENWDVTPYIYKAEFYRIGTKDSLGNWHGKIVDYYKDDRPQMKGTYDRGLKQGVFIYYNDDGTYSSAGQYYKDELVGKWEYYYTKNRLYSEVRYINDFSYIENILDTLGNYMVKGGKGEEIERDAKGQILFKKTIEGGLNHGVSEGFYEDGRLFFREYHNHGYLEYGISYDSVGNSYRYEEETAWPYPDGGYDDLVKYFELNNKFKNNKIDDYVELKFIVKPDGGIRDIVFTKSINPKYDQHASELLLNGPYWHPGRYKGFIKVHGEAYVQINF